MILAVGLGAAAYVFLDRYAVYQHTRDELAVQQDRLRIMTAKQHELTRKQKIVKQVNHFSDQAKTLGLYKRNWTFYDVHVQDNLSFEAAEQILQQCAHSPMAYYWPISLEIKVMDKAQQNKSASPDKPIRDVQLTVRGQFVARK